MRSNKERIRLMHERAAGIQREKDRGRLIIAGGISTALFVVLISLTIYLQGLTGYLGGQFTASSILSENAGGYVLVGVIFFMLGVLISVALIRYQKRKHRLKDPDMDNKNAEEGFDR